MESTTQKAVRRVQVTEAHLVAVHANKREGGTVETHPTHSAGSQRTNRGFLDVQKVLTLELECKQLLFPDCQRFRKELSAWIKRHKQILYHDFSQDRTDARWQGMNIIPILFSY
jgi:hypothetical protein